ncbi:MAG TPA: ricin-type beta-trefoil lectin domain protein, partial [Polyangia bacterium]
VWRNNNYTPVFDTGYQYTFSGVATAGNPMLVDAGTSPVQQWNQSANLVSSVFTMASSGSAWTISPIDAPAKCLDAGAGTNGTGVVANACNGTSSQKWNVTANAMNGSFDIAAASSGRCLSVRSGSTTAGAVIEVDDCAVGRMSEEFNIQATYYAPTGSGASSGSGGSGGTNPCASFCSNPTTIASESYSATNLATGGVCYQSTFPIVGFNCGNMSGRTFSVNGAAVSCGGNFTAPAKVNGGYCFQATAGGTPAAYFGTW